MPRPCCPWAGREGAAGTLMPFARLPRHPRGCGVFHLITIKNTNLWKMSLKQRQALSQSSESVSWRCRAPRAGGERDLLLFLPFLRGDGWRPRPSLLRLRGRAGLRLPLPAEDPVSCRRRAPCRGAAECCCAFRPWCLQKRQKLQRSQWARQRGGSGGGKGILESQERPTEHPDHVALLNPSSQPSYLLSRSGEESEDDGAASFLECFSLSFFFSFLCFFFFLFFFSFFFSFLDFLLLSGLQGRDQAMRIPALCIPLAPKTHPHPFPGTSHHIPPLPKRSPQRLFRLIHRDAKQAQCQTEPWKHFVKYFPYKPGHFWWFPTEVGKILTVPPPPSPPFPASSWRQMSLGCWRLSGARVGGEKNTE